MTFLPSPPAPAARAWAPRVLFAWLAIIFIAVVRARDEIAALAFGDPDDMLRLLQVRSLLGGQGWFDLIQHRINPPAGVVMHWSRLVDLPIAACIALFNPILGTANAEMAAAVIVPMLTLLAALLLVGRLAARLVPQEQAVQAAFFAALMWLIAFPVRNQIDPLRIDHHGWQIVAVLAAMNGLAARDARRGGWLVGTALGLGMAISLELLPFTALFAGVFALRWISGQDERGWLVHMLTALAVSSLAAFALTKGPDLTGYCDAVSPAYLAGFAAAAVLTGIAAKLPPWHPLMELALLGGVAIGVAALFLVLAPQCSTGPFAQLDPLVRDLWLANVFEGMPVWHQGIEVLVQMMVPPLFGLLCAAVLWHFAPADKRRAWLEITLLLAGSLVIAAAVARFSAVAGAIATLTIGCALRPLLNRLSALKSPLAQLASLLLLIAVLVPGLAMLATYKIAPALRPAGSAAKAAAAEAPYPQCGLPTSLDALAGLPKGTVFAPLDMGPGLLLRTPHSVVATGHHRASAAIRDVLVAHTASPDEARVVIKRHGPTYFLTCDEIGETGVYKTKAPKGLMAALSAGKVPVWLDPVKLPEAARTLKLWRVR